MDFYGHPTGIRSVALSSDDRLACTVSKNVTKIWKVSSRSCIQSLSPELNTKSKGCYGLCASFLPGNTHVAVGSREGHLILIDISAGDVVCVEEGAHEAAIWSIDIQPQSLGDRSPITLVTGSADKSVKFWIIETQTDEDEESNAGQPMFVHTRTLNMADDVIAVRYSKSPDPAKRLVVVSTLDSTIKVVFDNSLKLFLSLYGHKLPALAIDCSDDSALLASSGADKTVKVWGLDFGDTHKTLHGHEDSVTDLRFVRRTHNFFTASKDGSVRYWDGDRFEQILLLNGHFAEVNCLAISKSGAFVLSGGMDRQVRVWERTKDIVFLEEEREIELEKMFDKVNDRNEGTTSRILDKKHVIEEDNQDTLNSEPQSESAVRRSVLSVAAGDRLMEGIERADLELKEIQAFRNLYGAQKERPPNMMMLGMQPAPYVLWVLKTIKSVELEQCLVILSVKHVERLLYYIVLLLQSGQGVELCSRTAVFTVKAHQNQVCRLKQRISWVSHVSGNTDNCHQVHESPLARSQEAVAHETIRIARYCWLRCCRFETHSKCST